jgi:low temperature requirement protein LtrA
MAMAAGAHRTLLRLRRGHEHNRVTYVELFFDLVFVFAVTQLSHALIEHLSWQGLVETTLLLMAVWWVWIYTSWVTNWLDPERTPVRLMLFVLMLAGLVLSTSIPKAFEAKGLAFAGAYVFMQVGRSLFMLWALSGQNEANYRNFLRITAWLVLSGMFWLAGAFAEAGLRLALWIMRLASNTSARSCGSGRRDSALPPRRIGTSRAAISLSGAGSSSSSRSASRSSSPAPSLPTWR